MPKHSQGTIEDECDLGDLVKQASAFKPAEEVQKEDALPHLHYLTQHLPVCTTVMESFMHSESVGRVNWVTEDTATTAAIKSHGFGKPQIILPRLGQGSFRIVVTDAYERRCALTGERTLPVLDAAHIKPYSVDQRHEVSNGILMRSDLHRLFDEGYITIDPLDRRIQVSGRIREEFENGKDYYKLHGHSVRDPNKAIFRPLAENLEYHAYTIFR
jgi:HNH endonuclease